MRSERLFVEHLSTIERVIRSVARRHRLPAREFDDFASVVCVRLLENDCEILHAHAGRSSMATYLTVVVTRLLLDHRNQELGRWRPSSVARRLGPLAVALERLVCRDGRAPREAIEVLLSSGPVHLDETVLWKLWRQLPRRTPPATLAECGPPFALDPDPVQDTQDACALKGSLLRVLTELPTEDRLLLDLHFARGIPLIAIAKTWGVSRATLMRRFARILWRCRSAAVESGVSRTRLLELVERGRVILRLFESDRDETVGTHGRLRHLKGKDAS